MNGSISETQETSPNGHLGGLDLGRWIGRREAFGAIAGRCSAAEVESLRRIRQEKHYRVATRNWDDFCALHLRASRRSVDRVISYLEEFGPAFFHIAQLAHIGAKEYRTIAPHVGEDGVKLDGDVIALLPENSQKLTEAIGALLRHAEPKEPTPADEILSTLIQRCRNLAAALTALPALDDCQRVRLGHAVADLQKVRLCYGRDSATRVEDGHPSHGSAAVCGGTIRSCGAGPRLFAGFEFAPSALDAWALGAGLAVGAAWPAAERKRPTCRSRSLAERVIASDGQDWAFRCDFGMWTLLPFSAGLAQRDCAASTRASLLAGACAFDARLAAGVLRRCCRSGRTVGVVRRLSASPLMDRQRHCAAVSECDSASVQRWPGTARLRRKRQGAGFELAPPSLRDLGIGGQSGLGRRNWWRHSPAVRRRCLLAGACIFDAGAAKAVLPEWPNCRSHLPAVRRQCL